MPGSNSIEDSWQDPVSGIMEEALGAYLVALQLPLLAELILGHKAD